MNKLLILLALALVTGQAYSCDEPIKPVDMTSNGADVFDIDLDQSLELRLKKLHDFYGPKAKPVVDKILVLIKKRVGGSLGMFVLKQAVSAFLYARAPSYLFDEV